jgi:hypothetical protein
MSKGVTPVMVCTALICARSTKEKLATTTRTHAGAGPKTSVLEVAEILLCLRVEKYGCLVMAPASSTPYATDWGKAVLTHCGKK